MVLYRLKRQLQEIDEMERFKKFLETGKISSKPKSTANFSKYILEGNYNSKLEL